MPAFCMSKPATSTSYLAPADYIIFSSCSRFFICSQCVSVANLSTTDIPTPITTLSTATAAQPPMMSSAAFMLVPALANVRSTNTPCFAAQSHLHFQSNPQMEMCECIAVFSIFTLTVMSSLSPLLCSKVRHRHAQTILSRT